MSKKYIDVAEFEYEDDNLQYLDTDVVEEAYESGLVQILQRVGQTKDDSTLFRVPEDINVFEALDNSNCKINEFTLDNCKGEMLFRFLSHSNQSKHVETLSLVDTEIIPSDSLKSLTSLESACVSFSGGDYKVVKVNCTSYLKYLSIQCPFFTIQYNINS
jgi:hypothetical protein